MKELILPVLAIMSVTCLVSVALANGINGTVMAGGIAVVGGLGGYGGRIFVEKRRKR